MERLSSEIKYQEGFDQRSSLGNSLKSEPDIFTLEYGKSYRQKNEVKTEQNMSIGSQPYKKTVLSQKISWMANSKVPNPKEYSVIVTTTKEDDEGQKHFPLDESFKPEDIWDPEKNLFRQMQGGNSEDRPMTIDNLKELPKSKHVLNKPQEYRPIGEPIKKKQYRPVVPHYFHSGFDTYLQRRKVQIPNDLGVRSLDEIVQECQKRKLIPIDIATIFLNKSGTQQIMKDFIDLWQKGQIYQYNFQNHPFTYVDHRRLSELLLHFYPDDYTLGSIDAFHVNQKEFMYRVYSLNAEKYVRLYMTLDKLSRCTWWKQLKNRYADSEHFNYFQIKESLPKDMQPLESYESQVLRSEDIRDSLGTLRLQDNEAELQKILSSKFKPSNRQFRSGESMVSGYQQLGRSEVDEDEYGSQKAIMQSSGDRYQDMNDTNNDIYEEEEEEDR